MTVGLPGAGVGGIFYLLSALLMPVNAIIRQVMNRGSASPDPNHSTRWGLVWRQFATAVGIIAGLWITGWLLASYLIANPGALGSLQTAAVGQRLPNVLKIGAVIVSFGTLAAVLVAVEIARLVVKAPPPDAAPAAPDSKGKSRIAAMLLFALLSSAVVPRMLNAQEATSLDNRIAAGDRAWADGDTASARREYEAAIAIDPEAGRALYRLGELNRARPKAAREFFLRYTAAEPGDAWGWIALGNAYGAEGRLAEGLRAYERAAALAPGERDVAIGRARLLARAGRTDQAITAYENWTASNTSDGEALLELGDQRRRAGRYREASRAYALALEAGPSSRAASRLALSRSLAAPWAELHADGSRDTDEDRTARIGLAASAFAGDRIRLVAGGSRKWVSGPLDFGYPEFTIDEAFAGIEGRPASAVRFEARAGAALPRSSDEDADESAVITGRVLGKWRQPGGRASVELQGSRILLDVTPALVSNRVVRTEGAARIDLPLISRLSLRGGGRLSSYDSQDDTNTRTSALGGLIIAVTPALEIGGVYQRIAFDHESFAGYFTPRMAHLAEAATYMEIESASGVVLAVDAGAGAARFQLFGQPQGNWEPAYRLMSSLHIPVRASTAIRLELDTYDSRIAGDAATAGASWRFISLAAALRVGLR
jgi:tetratricopeptide (TPR) repeat protein